MLPMIRHADPAPSRLAYRLERLWLRKRVRWAVSTLFPLAMLALALTLISIQIDARSRVEGFLSDLRMQLTARPEVQVNSMAVNGASAELQAQVAAVLDIEWPVSSLLLDVEAIQRAVVGLDAVKSAEVRILNGGKLQIDLIERGPAIVLLRDDRVELWDEEGFRVAAVLGRAEAAALPVITGEGAERAIPEALELWRIAAPISMELRGLIRMGDRRWNLLLDSGLVVMLPEEGAAEALRHVLAVHRVDELLERDILSVDMRNPERPTLRLTPFAADELRRIRAAIRGDM